MAGFDGFWIGCGIAAAGWFVSRAVQSSKAFGLSVQVKSAELSELAEAMRYAAKSARGAIRTLQPPPPPPDPREAQMAAWLSRHPEIIGLEAENLMATWHIAVGISPSQDGEKEQAIVTLKVYGAPLPSDIPA